MTAIHLGLETGAVPPGVRPLRPKRFVTWVGGLITVGLIAWSGIGLDVSWERLLRAPARLAAAFEAMARNFQWDLLPTALGEMWTSVAIAWLGTMLAALVAVPFGLVAAENVVPRSVSFAMRQVFNVLRAVPELVLVLMILPVLGFRPSAGVLALAIGSIGTLSKLCSEVVEGIDTGPVEAVDASGASFLQRLRWAVIPQSAPEIASFILYRFEINIRVSAILGVLGVGGIGGKLSDALRYKEWGLAGARLIVVVMVTILIDLASGWVRRRLLAGPMGTSAADTSADHQVELMADSYAHM